MRIGGTSGPVYIHVYGPESRQTDRRKASRSPPTTVSTTTSDSAYVRAGARCEFLAVASGIWAGSCSAFSPIDPDSQRDARRGQCI
jgi:hypothetical protein